MFINSLRFVLSSVDSEISNGVVGGASEPSASWTSYLFPLIMLGGFALVFYFLLILPEKKRKKQAQEQRDSMKVGDTVVTIGGITGEIEEIRGETIRLFTGSNSIDIQKWAIRSIEADEIAEEASEKQEAQNPEAAKEAEEVQENKEA